MFSSVLSKLGDRDQGRECPRGGDVADVAVARALLKVRVVPRQAGGERRLGNLKNEDFFVVIALKKKWCSVRTGRE